MKYADRKGKAIFKFNGGRLAMLCSKCTVIIKIGNDFTQEEHLAAMGKVKLAPQYCEKCKKEMI